MSAKRQRDKETSSQPQQVFLGYPHRTLHWHLLAHNATALHDPEIGEVGQALHLPLSDLSAPASSPVLESL